MPTKSRDWHMTSKYQTIFLKKIAYQIKKIALGNVTLSRIFV